MWENAGNEFKIILAESFRKMLAKHGQNHFPWVVGMSSWWFQFFFEFSPQSLGEDSHFDEYFFQMGCSTTN